MIRHALKAALSRRPGWDLAAPLRPAGVVVLMYHRIPGVGEAFRGTDVDTFREQMRWLRRHCDPIAAEELPGRLRRPSRRRPAVLVTFDDGYRDYHDNAYPVLRELGIPAVVFLATSFMGTDRLIWTDEVWSAFHRSRLPAVAFPWAAAQVHPLDGAAARERAERAAKAYLKDIPDPERERWQEALFRALEVDPRDGALGRQMLSWDEVRATRDGTCYGGHTHRHPILSRLAATQADEEIRLSSDEIARELGERPTCFAYPNGRARDFNEENRASLRRHGFRLAFSTIEGANGPDADLLALRRQPTGASSLADFAWLVSGR